MREAFVAGSHRKNKLFSKQKNTFVKGIFCNDSNQGYITKQTGGKKYTEGITVY